MKTPRKIYLDPDVGRDIKLLVLDWDGEFTADDVHLHFPWLERVRIANKLSRLYQQGVLEEATRVNTFVSYRRRREVREDPEVAFARLYGTQRYEDFIPRRVLANVRTAPTHLLLGSGLRITLSPPHVQPLRGALP